MDTPIQAGKYLLIILMILVLLAGGYFVFLYGGSQKLPKEQIILSESGTQNQGASEETNLSGSMTQNLADNFIASSISRLLYVATSSGMQVVMEDSKILSKPYSHIIRLKANPQGSGFSFLGRNETKRVLVSDGEEYKNYEYIKDFWYIPKSQTKLAYVAHEQRKETVVYDGIPSEPFERVGTITFSSDGKHYAYEVQDSSNSMVIYDGKKIKYFKFSSDPIFSLQGESFAFIASNEKFGMDGKRLVIRDDTEIYSSQEKINSLSMSPDGKHLAYKVERDGKVLIVKDGVEEKPYDYMRMGKFFPDGKSFAYIAENEGKWMIVRDGKESEPYEMMYFFTFSPDGKGFSYAGKKDGKWHLSQDGKIKYSYDEIGQMLYTPDGKGFAFQAKKGEKRVVVRDGAESSEYDYAGDLEYSPDSKTLTFLGQSGNTGNLIVNFEPLSNSTGVNAFVR